MQARNKVIKNASWIIACKITQSLLGVAITMISARVLEPTGYGIIQYAMSIVAFVTPVMNLGLSGVLVQEFVNNPEEEGKIIGTSLAMTLLSSVFCIGGVTLFCCIADAGETETILVCVLYSLILISQAFEITQYWFQAKLKSKFSSIAALIAYIVISVYKILVLLLGGSIYMYALSNAFDYMIIAIVLLIIYHKQGGQRLSFSWEKAKSMFSRSKYYIISNLMITIFVQTDKIMLKFMLGIESTGFYSAGVTCATMTAFVFGAIIDSMRPIIFESKKTSEELFKKNTIRLFSIIIYFSLLQSLVVTIFAPFIIRIIYGSDYMQAVAPIRVVVWYTTFSYMGAVRNIWLLAENKQKYILVMNMSGALINVGLNFVFIPILGMVGAALASLLTQIFNNLIINFIVRPVAGVNKLIFKSLNPQYIMDFVKSIFRRKKKHHETD